MGYVSRRIQFNTENGVSHTVSDSEFAALDAPLVLLGEPGAGKTETAGAIADLRSGVRISAHAFALGAPVEIDANTIPVIDGLDEVQVSSADAPILIVLKRLAKNGCKSFVITCRAADWSNVQNEYAIATWFGQAPINGHLQPLSDEEMVAVVNELGTFPEGGASFLNQARQRDAIDLARNPQSLKLLLAAVKETGWPRTKTELYELACRNLATESNGLHQSLAHDRPAIETTLSSAGFVFAQLLLCNQRGVNVDGQDIERFPRPALVASDDVNVAQIEAAASSQLFRPVGAGNIEYTHRTVAEYLAAKWLNGVLEDGKLSARRLQALLHTQDTVPGPLRGLYAWLATLHRDMTSLLVPRDPYGCLRYGDVSQFTLQQTRDLIGELQKLAKIDPYFRSQDWDAQVGSGLARHELRSEIVGLIQNPNVPYQLSTVVLESLKGSELAGTILHDLREVAANEQMSYATRDRALTALETNNPNENWHSLVGRLIGTGSHSSLRMAIEIIIDHTSVFNGEEIAQVVLAYDQANEKRSVGMLLGIDYRLWQRMTAHQLATALNQLSSQIPSERYNRTGLQRKTEDRLVQALQVMLGKTDSVTGGELISWLEKVTLHGHRRQDWNTFSIEYFKNKPQLRRELQASVIRAAESDDRWLADFRLSEMAAGLMLRDEDVAFHLETLVTNEQQHHKSSLHWVNLAEWIFSNRAFASKSEQVARQQAESRPALKAILYEIENRPPPTWLTEEEARKQRLEREERERNLARHQSFAEIRSEVAAGRHLDALKDIATAYLGLFAQVSDVDEPVSRVSWLVGKANLDSSLTGLLAACHRLDIPTPRQMAELEVSESQSFVLGRVMLAACAVHTSNGADLAELPREALLCALAACQWGLYSDERLGADSLEEALRRVLFPDADGLEAFVRDTIEPALFAGHEHVSGVWQITREESFSHLRRTLCLDWLRRNEHVSIQSLRYLLEAAIDACERSELSDLIHHKLAASSLQNEGHRRLWLAAAFAVDFIRFQSAVRAFSAEGPDTLIPLRSVTFSEHRDAGRDTSVAQLAFLIETYAEFYPLIEPPGSGWGPNEPYECARFIAGCISRLGEILTSDSQAVLERLVQENSIGNHSDNARHVLAEHTRAMAEAGWSTPSLNAVRNVLLACEPITSNDLQQLVLDELMDLQKRLRHGVFNGILPFWDNGTPHSENYCRDRIAEHLEPRMARFGVRVHPEGAMPDGMRCDLLCTVSEMNLPIEIKGQWHPDVWGAAKDQLEENYSRDYRADGRGVYLVLWFGNVQGRNPPGVSEFGRVESAEHMLASLSERSPEPVSEKTSLLVLDLEQP